MVAISCQLDRNFLKKQTSCRPLEEQIVQRNTDSGGPAHEVSEGNKGSIGNWANGCPFDNLLLAALYPCPENYRETDIRSNGMAWGSKISS